MRTATSGFKRRHKDLQDRLQQKKIQPELILTNFDVIEQIAKDTGLSKIKAEEVLFSMYEAIEKELKCKMNSVSIHGFIRLYYKKKKGNMGKKLTFEAMSRLKGI